MTAPESIAVSINQIDEKKQNLKKAFDDLQAHRSLLSPSFNLSWSEIDSHFSSRKSSLFNRFRLLQSATPPPPPPDSSKIESSTADTTEVPVQWPELRKFCEKNDGKSLGKYMIDNSKKRFSINLELLSAIRCSQNPAALVLDAIQGNHNLCSPSSSSSAKTIDVRRIFVLLLEALTEINANLTNDLRERARTLAYDWKSNIANKPSEALGFLHLVSAFELGSLFSIDELCDYVLLISTYKQVTTICRKIGLDRKKITELIKKFLDTGRVLVAFRFIYEYEMTDEFEPVSILKTSLKECREAAKKVCVEGKYSLKAQNEATDKELSALRGVIKIVKEKKLESDFLEEKLEECVKELEDQKTQRKRAAKLTASANLQQQQQQQKGDNKRPRVANSMILSLSQQQPPLLPNPSQGLQVNPYVRSILPGVAGPFGNPMAIFGSVPAPSSQPVFYEQQSGYGRYGLPPPQYFPPYYPH